MPGSSLDPSSRKDELHLSGSVLGVVPLSCKEKPGRRMISPQGRHPRVRADVIGLTPTLNSTGHKISVAGLRTINHKSVIRSFAGLLKADAGTRTPDPFITSEVLYQLSYVGACRGFPDLPALRPDFGLRGGCKILVGRCLGKRSRRRWRLLARGELVGEVQHWLRQLGVDDTYGWRARSAGHDLAPALPALVSDRGRHACRVGITG